MKEPRIGDRIEVTNTYKGRLGVIGVVIKLGKAQVTVRNEIDGVIFRKYKQNLTKVEDE